MSRPAGSARRSGDPRKRAAAEAPPPRPPWLRLAVVLGVLAVLTVVAVVALGSREDAPDDAALAHAEVACDYTAKAEEASAVATDARIAAAVLLLDQAIVASERAAGIDPALADLDEAVRAVHAAGHRGEPAAYDEALEAALDACRTTLG